MPPKVTTQDIKKRLFEKVGNEYSIESEYIKGTVPMKFKHNKCGNIITVSPNHFFYDNRRCNCFGKNSKSPKVFEKEFYSFKDSVDYELLSTYERSERKVKVKHKICGNIYFVSPKAFLRGQRCPKCYGNHRKTTEQFSKEINNSTNGEFILLSEYINNRVKVEIKHTICGNTYKVTPKDFLNGNRCPYCKQSKGERFIKETLDSYNISYTIQKTYEDLKNKGKYSPYDFAILGKDNNVICLVEYDGIQHFKEVKYFGGRTKLESQQRRDKMKNNYAKSIGVELLRIPYTMTKEEIKQLLKKFINM